MNIYFFYKEEFKVFVFDIVYESNIRKSSVMNYVVYSLFNIVIVLIIGLFYKILIIYFFGCEDLVIVKSCF